MAETIIITGNMGYVGPEVVAIFRKLDPTKKLIGLDAGFFATCLMNRAELPERRLDEQHFIDIRNVTVDFFTDAACVIHLAAVSNDPMGKAFERPTIEINTAATAALGRMAKTAGVRRFVFASSCSIYGSTGNDAKTEAAPLDPLTAYARSKLASERELEKIADERFQVTCLRFATACGFGERLRLDLVLNDFVASAVATGEIKVLSDGTPWRPLIHVKDMARLFHWASSRPLETGAFLAVNAGRDDWNYQIRELAEAVAGLIPGSHVSINKHASPDNRSYKVDFGLLASLAPAGLIEYDLTRTVRELHHGLSSNAFRDVDFRSSDFIRLKVLSRLVDNGRLDRNLYWQA